MFVGLFTLVPLRVFLIAFTVYLSCGAVLFFHYIVQSRPLTKWTLRMGCRIQLFLHGFVHIEVVGRIPAACPPIVVSNHLSNIEILHLITILDEPSFVTKMSNFDIPMIGRMARDILQSVGLDRSNKSNHVTKQIVERVTNKTSSAESRPPLVIFPEGTTSNGTCLLSFKKGAFIPMQPVLPIVYTFPRSGSFIPTFESIFVSVYYWRLLSQPWNNLRCVILSPMSPPVDSPRETAVHDYARSVRNTMANSLNLPLVDMNYSDKIAYHDKLRAYFSDHPRGALWAMCFEPMYQVDGDCDVIEKKSE